MSDRPFARRCRGGRLRVGDVPVTAGEPCARLTVPAVPFAPAAAGAPGAEGGDAWLRLDAAGRPRLSADGTWLAADELAPRLCAELGEVLGRPVELLSVRENPVGHRHLVSIATREIGRDGPELRAAAAGGPSSAAALVDALVAAHLGTEPVVRAAAGRLVADGVIASARLVEDGVAREFGAHDRPGPPTRLAPGRPTGPGRLPTREMRLASAVLVATLTDDRAAQLFDLWAGAVRRRAPAPAPAAGSRS